MKRIVSIASLAFGLLLSAPAGAVKVGDTAPDFTVPDAHGKAHKLADTKGKYTVLEWHNEGCPYVQKFYGSGALPKLQKQWMDKGVAWYVVISSAPGAQGHADGKAAEADMQKHKAAPTAVLLDSAGALGKAYGAKTTPHMFVINPEGKVIYNGAIDDKPTTEASDIPGAKNYVSLALESAMAGKPVAEATTQPYGCSVKYAH
jgi:thioredoxin-related protein